MAEDTQFSRNYETRHGQLDDNKHTERVPVYFTEREFLDLCRSAAAYDKKPAEYVRWRLRQSMYGTVGVSQRDGNENGGAE